MDKAFLEAYNRARSGKAPVTKPKPAVPETKEKEQADTSVSEASSIIEPAVTPVKEQTPLQEAIPEGNSPTAQPDAEASANPTPSSSTKAKDTEASTETALSQPQELELAVTEDRPTDIVKSQPHAITAAEVHEEQPKEPKTAEAVKPEPEKVSPAEDEKPAAKSFIFKDSPSPIPTTEPKAAAKKGTSATIPRKLLFALTVLVLLIIIAVVAAVAFRGQVAGIFFSKKAGLAQTPSNPAVLGKQQALADQYVAEIGKLTALPTDEKPTVATVTDVEKLRKTQPFFNDAQNGDVVLIYSKKAILYDPQKHVIVDIAPVNLISPSPSQSPLATPLPSATALPIP